MNGLVCIPTFLTITVAIISNRTMLPGCLKVTHDNRGEITGRVILAPTATLLDLKQAIAAHKGVQHTPDARVESEPPTNLPTVGIKVILRPNSAPITMPATIPAVESGTSVGERDGEGDGDAATDAAGNEDAASAAAGEGTPNDARDGDGAQSAPNACTVTIIVPVVCTYTMLRDAIATQAGCDRTDIHYIVDGFAVLNEKEMLKWEHVIDSSREEVSNTTDAAASATTAPATTFTATSTSTLTASAVVKATAIASRGPGVGKVASLQVFGPGFHSTDNLAELDVHVQGGCVDCNITVDNCKSTSWGLTSCQPVFRACKSTLNVSIFIPDTDCSTQVLLLTCMFSYTSPYLQLSHDRADSSR
jgi:hypothetical protein